MCERLDERESKTTSPTKTAHSSRKKTKQHSGKAMHVRDRAALEMPLLRDHSNDLTNQCFASLHFFTSAPRNNALPTASANQVHYT